MGLKFQLLKVVLFHEEHTYYTLKQKIKDDEVTILLVMG